MVKAIFWDRDGVINRAVVRPDGRSTAPWNMGEVSLYPHVVSAMNLAYDYGFLNFVVTNQPDVLTGDAELDYVLEYHSFLMKIAPISAVTFESDRSSPRYKPGAQMILELIDAYGVDPSESYMVGDSWKDMEAGRRAGLTTVFVDSGRERREDVTSYLVTDSAFGAAQAIMIHSGVPA